MEKVHFIASHLVSPSNPVTVNLIGAGGTGSAMITALGRINNALIALEHPGLQVNLFDAGKVTETNVKRQLFADTEIGLPKAVCLINRVNRFWGTNWKAVTRHYNKSNLAAFKTRVSANITISCVDTVSARFEIASILENNGNDYNITMQPLYWMDLGNSRHTGQALLGTVSDIHQPDSKMYRPVASLPVVTKEFGTALRVSEKNETGPTCSAAEALSKQDLFINPILANLAAKFLKDMIIEGMTDKRGFFVNIDDYQMQPLYIGTVKESAGELSMAA